MSYGTRRRSDFSEVKVDIATSGDNTIIASGAEIRIYYGFVIAASSVGLDVKSGATSLTGVMTIGSAFWLHTRYPWFTIPAGSAFILNLSGNVQVSGRLYYQQG